MPQNLEGMISLLRIIMPSQEGCMAPESDQGKSPESGRRSPGTSFDTILMIKKEVEERRRRVRKAEKVEKVMHLVCWGPN